MCDEIRLFGMLNRIDERTQIMQEQQANIFERLGALEQKSPVCSYHDGIVADIGNLKTDTKIANVKLVLITSVITTVAVIFLMWITNNMPFLS